MLQLVVLQLAAQQARGVVRQRWRAALRCSAVILVVKAEFLFFKKFFRRQLQEFSTLFLCVREREKEGEEV